METTLYSWKAASAMSSRRDTTLILNKRRSVSGSYVMIGSQAQISIVKFSLNHVRHLQETTQNSICILCSF